MAEIPERIDISTLEIKSLINGLSYQLDSYDNTCTLSEKKSSLYDRKKAMQYQVSLLSEECETLRGAHDNWVDQTDCVELEAKDNDDLQVNERETDTRQVVALQPGPSARDVARVKIPTALDTLAQAVNNYRLAIYTTEDSTACEVEQGINDIEAGVKSVRIAYFDSDYAIEVE